MAHAYDPYYRDFPSNLLPAHTPFTRAGQGDAGHVFIYMTRKWRRGVNLSSEGDTFTPCWSLVLDRSRLDLIHAEARQCIPPGFSQLWLLEKRYSTARPGGRARPVLTHPPVDRRGPPPKTILEEQLLVVLREPPQRPDGKGDVLSYHLRETEALRAAEAYTRRSRHRAVVAGLLWDELWF